MSKDISKTLGKVIGGSVVVAGSLAVIALIASSSALKSVIKEFGNMGKTIHDVSNKEEIILHEVNIDEKE